MTVIDQASTVRLLRMAMLGLFLLGVAGTLAELLLLAHDEDAIQLIPVVLAGVGLLIAMWNAIAPGAASIRTMQVLAVLFIAAGLAGVFYHYDANVEFQRELEPTLQGSALLWKVLQAKAPPALSPGLMVQLGLLALAFTFRHPAVSKGDLR